MTPNIPQRYSFVQAFLSGLVDVRDADDWVDEWNYRAMTESTLAQFMGLTDQEYFLYVQDPGKFALYMNNRRLQEGDWSKQRG